MSKADEMLKECKFNQIEDNEHYTIYTSEFFNTKRQIKFWKKDKIFYNDLIRNNETISSFFIDIKLLQAINEKCRELEWIE